jgi:hypothetical protein
MRSWRSPQKGLCRSATGGRRRSQARRAGERGHQAARRPRRGGARGRRRGDGPPHRRRRPLGPGAARARVRLRAPRRPAGRAADAGQPPLIAALDGVTDPRNLGAVVRSAGAFGAHGVLVPSRRGAGVTAGAWKASAGAIARVPVARGQPGPHAAGVSGGWGLPGRPGRGRRHRDQGARPGHRPVGPGHRLRGPRPVQDRRASLRRAGQDPDRGPDRVAECRRDRGHRALRGGRDPVQKVARWSWRPVS